MLAKDLIKILEADPDIEVRITSPDNPIVAYEVGTIKLAEVLGVDLHSGGTISAFILEGIRHPDDFWELSEWVG